MRFDWAGVDADDSGDVGVVPAVAVAGYDGAGPAVVAAAVAHEVVGAIGVAGADHVAALLVGTRHRYEIHSR